MTSLPTEILLNITSHFSVAQFLRFRGVCRNFHQVVVTSERSFVRQLLQSSELQEVGKLFGNTGAESETYKHLFGLIRRCSIVDTLANFMSGYPLEDYLRVDQLKTKIQSQLLLLTHFLEHYLSSLNVFVFDPKNKNCLGVQNQNIRDLTVAKYDLHVVEILNKVHFWLFILLQKRLEGRSLTLFNEEDNEEDGPPMPHAELILFGGIEAIKDCLLPDTLKDRIMQMHTHMVCAGSKSSVDDIEHRLSELPARRVELALSLNPITPLLDRQTAANINGILPKDNDLFDCLPTR